MNNYIYNETLLGVIDWVNTVFTTLYPIQNIEEVYIGGAVYRNVSFTAGEQSITFATAPTIGMSQPTIDYFRADIEPTPDTSLVTLGDVLEDVYDYIGQERIKNWQPNKVYKESIIKKHITKGFDRIRNMRYYKDNISSFSFNKAKDWEAWDYSPTSLFIGERDYVPANWYYLVKDSAVVNYTSFVEGNLNWGSGFVYKKGDLVSIGYRLPNIVKKVSEIIIDWVALEYRDIREFKINSSYYTIYLTQSGNRYLFLPFTKEDKLVTVRYIQNYTEPTLDTDIINIEREYSEVLSLYAAYRVFLFREDDRARDTKGEYLEALNFYKAYKSRATDNTNGIIKSWILNNF